MKLDLVAFDEAPFAAYLERCARDGVRFETMASLGDAGEERRRLYELNRTCSSDIPGRGPFFSFEEYVTARLAVPTYAPAGTVVALARDEWIGLAAVSDWRAKGFAFNEMTGVRADHRGRGVAIAMKLLGIRFARSTGVRWLYTFHAAENAAAIAMNRRLGYVDADFDEATLFERGL